VCKLRSHISVAVVAVALIASIGIWAAVEALQGRQAHGRSLPRPVVGGPSSAANPGPGGAASAGDTAPGCEWFTPWRASEPGPDSCLAVVEAMRPMTSDKVRCLSAPWLVALLRAHCAKQVALSVAEIDLMIRASQGDLSAHVLADGREGQHSVCMATLLSGEPAVLPSASWANLMAQAGAASEGSIFTADPALIQVAARLLESHPITDREWWERFWEAIPEGPGATHARKAVYEAITQVIDAPRRQPAFRFFADLEDTSRPSASTGLAALGVSMRGLVAAPDALASMATDPSPNWRRACLWSIDQALLWPSRPVAVDDAVAQALLHVLRVGTDPTAPNDRNWRLDLLGQSWRVLGPRLGAQEFTEYVARPLGDEWEAGYRIAIVSYEVGRASGSQSPEDQAAIEQASESLAALLDLNRNVLDELLSLALDHGLLRGRAARDTLIRALGVHVRTLGKDTYERLVQ